MENPDKNSVLKKTIFQIGNTPLTGNIIIFMIAGATLFVFLAILLMGLDAQQTLGVSVFEGIKLTFTVEGYQRFALPITILAAVFGSVLGAVAGKGR